MLKKILLFAPMLIPCILWFLVFYLLVGPFFVAREFHGYLMAKMGEE